MLVPAAFALCGAALPASAQLVVQPVDGGALFDDDLDGIFDRAIPGNVFGVGGSIQSIAGSYEAQGGA
jgi:hypothetical protein